jgi:hypothetical protein
MLIVTCDHCGRARPVVAAHAGETIPCLCGQQIRVPPLSELRRIAGDPVPLMGIADQLRAMYLERELPPEPRCACCQVKTSETLECWVECERARVEGTLPWHILLGILFTILSPLRGLIFLAGRNNPEIEASGNDLVVRTPLPLCENCLHTTSRRESNLRQLLQSVPLYRQLLDAYPGARVGAS